MLWRASKTKLVLHPGLARYSREESRIIRNRLAVADVSESPDDLTSNLFHFRVALSTDKNGSQTGVVVAVPSPLLVNVLLALAH